MIRSIAAAVLFFALPVGAAEIHVATSGEDGPSCGADNTPCASLNGALAVAQQGDGVIIGPGVFTTTNALVADDVTIRGAGASATVLDGGGVGRVLHISPDAVTTIEQLSIVGGSVTGEGGAPAFGGAILNEGALTLRHVRIADSHVIGQPGAGGRRGAGGANGAHTGGGGQVVSCKSKEVRKGECDVSAALGRSGSSGRSGRKGGAGAQGGAAMGGAIYNSGRLTLDHAIVEGNSARGGDGGRGGRGGDGGDGAKGGPGSYLRVKYVVWLCRGMPGGAGGRGGDGGDGGDGGAGGVAYGGGVYSTGDAGLTIVNSTLRDNAATAGGAGAGGTKGEGGDKGGVGATGSRKKGCAKAPVTVDVDTSSSDGGDGDDGGGGGAGYALGGGLFVDKAGNGAASHQAMIEGALFAGNRAGFGSAILSASPAGLRITHASVIGNQATGGAALAALGQLALRNSVIAENTGVSEDPKTIAPRRLVRGVDQFVLTAAGAVVHTEAGGADIVGSCLPGRSEVACAAAFIAGAGPDGRHGTADDDYRLSLDWPGLDSADPAHVIGPDMRGAARDFPMIEGATGAADPGAFETAPEFLVISQLVTPPTEAASDSGTAFARPLIAPASRAVDFFWHEPTRRLYLIGDLDGGAATLTWRKSPAPDPATLLTMTPEEIAADASAANQVEQWVAARWPDDAPGQVTGAPLDLAPARAEGLSFQALAQVTSLGDAAGGVFRPGAPGSHSVLRFLPEGDNPADNPSPTFLAIRSLAATPTQDDAQCVIGAPLSRGADGAWPYVLDDAAPIDGDAHDRAARRGAVTPVGRTPFLAVWYNPGPLGLAFGDEVVRHECGWPADAAVVRLSERATGPQDDLPPGARVYRQPDPAQLGHRLNLAHAFVAKVQGGWRLSALQYPSDTDARYVIVRSAAGEGYRHKVYRIQPETPDAPLDPDVTYQVGEQILPPAPIRLLKGGTCAETAIEGPVYRARSGALWAQAATGDAADGVAGPIRVRWRYNWRDDFDGGPARGADGCAPWLADLAAPLGSVTEDGADNAAVAAFAQSARAIWPPDAQMIPVGKTELGGLDGQSHARLLHGGGLGARLFDPFVAVQTPLAEAPGTISRDEDGYFTGLPRHLTERIWHGDGVLSLRGRRDPVYGSDAKPLLYLNILSDADVLAIKALAPEDERFAEAVDALALASRAPARIARTEIGAGAKALSTGAATGTGHISVALNDAEGARGPFAIKVYRLSCPAYAAPVFAMTPPGMFDEALTLRYGADYGGETDRVRIDWRYRTARPPVDYGPWGDWGRLPGSADFSLDGDPNAGRGALTRRIAAPSDLSLTDLWVLARMRGFEDVCPPSDGSGAAGGAAGDGSPAVSGETEQTATAFARPAFAEGWVKRVLARLNAFQSRRQNILLESTALDTSLLAQAGPRYEGDAPLTATPEALSKIGLIEAYETVLRRARTLTIDRPEGSYDGASAPGGGDPLLMASARIAEMYGALADAAVADYSDPTLPLLSELDEQVARSTARLAFEGQVSTPLEEDLALLRGLSPPAGKGPVYNRLEWNTLGGATASALYATTYGVSFATDQPGGGDELTLREAARRAYPQGHGDAWGHYLSAQKSFYRLMRAPRFEWPFGRSAVATGDGGSLDVEFREERQFAALAAAKARTGVDIANATYRQAWSPGDAARLAGFPDLTQVTRRDPETGAAILAARGWGGDDWARRVGHGAYLDWAAGNALLPGAACETPPCGAKDRRMTRADAPELAAVAEAHERAQAALDRIAGGLNPLGLTGDDVPFGIDPNRIAFERNGHFGQVAEVAMRELESARASFDRIDFSGKFTRKAAEREQALRAQAAQQEADLRERLIAIYGRPYPEDVGPGRTYPGGGAGGRGYVGPDIYHYDMIDDDLGALFGEDYDKASLFTVTYQTHDAVAALLDTRREILSPAAAPAPEDQPFLARAPELLQAPLNFAIDLAGTPRAAPGGEGLLTPNVDIMAAARDDENLRVSVLPFSPELGGVLKPQNFTSARPAYGEIQLARTALVRELAGLRSAAQEYSNELELLRLHMDKLDKLIVGQANEQEILRRSREKILGLQVATLGLSRSIRFKELAEKMAEESAEQAAEATPRVVGVSNDPFAAVRAGILKAGSMLKGGFALTSLGLTTMRESVGVIREQIELDTNFSLLAGVARDKERLDEAQWILESALREPILRAAIVQQYQTVREAEMRYRSAVDQGRRLLTDLARLRRETSATVLGARYRDAVNGALRAEALSEYNRQVDAAARQVFRAALAYDYETIGSGYTRRGFERLLQDIIRQRAIGDVDGPRTVRGAHNGLAGILAQLIFRYETAFKPTSGFLQARTRALTLSLRSGLFEVGRVREIDEGGDPVLAAVQRNQSAAEDWRRALVAARRPDLRDIPEYAACCADARGGDRAAPGLVFTFQTRIAPGLNLFGNRLENDYQAPANAAAHRLQGVAVVLDGYNPAALRMSPNPQAFLIPVGRDVTQGKRGEGARAWRVRDVFADDPARLRAMTGMSVYPGEAAFFAEADPYHAGLIGRSLENTQWMLIIPARSFRANGEAALDKLLGLKNGRAEIEDIELRVQIYSYNEG